MSKAPTPLSQEEIAKRLEELPGWKVNENLLEKKFRFRLFKEALDFLNKVADAAESLNHHPDLLLYNYNRVKVSVTTHAVGGKITERDFKLATSIEKIPHKELSSGKAE